MRFSSAGQSIFGETRLPLPAFGAPLACQQNRTQVQGRQLLGDPGGLARVHHPELPMGQIEGHRPNPGQTTQRHANEVLLGGAVHSRN